MFTVLRQPLLLLTNQLLLVLGCQPRALPLECHAPLLLLLSLLPCLFLLVLFLRLQLLLLLRVLCA
ncbi:MAG: hypothetical protein EHM13_11720, partial [Acidobacteria bacterium]